MSGSPEDSLPEEEREFQKVIALVGGKEKVYLVSDACKSKGTAEEDAGLMEEFIRDVFEGGGRSGPETDVTTCPPRSGRTAKREVDVHSPRRAIHSPVIIFLFRQTFVGDVANEVRVREILKDVKARTKGARPALVGLVRVTQDGERSRQCALRLESLLRAVFHRHPPDTVWVGCFIPSAKETTLSIKRNACRVIQAAQTADNTRDRGNSLLWPFQCLSKPQGGGVGRPDNSTTANREKGDIGSIEESIPLNSSSLSTGRLEQSVVGEC